MGHDAAMSSADDVSMAICQTCGVSFDERKYQVVVSELGSFESIECAEKAWRRHTQRSVEEIATALLLAASHLQPQAAATQDLNAFAESEEGQPASRLPARP
jgi:hypothetical protein